MATLNTAFNAAAVEPAVGYDLIPAGTYTALVDDSDIKPTKANNGHYISLKLQIIEGQFQGRVVFANITVDNPNQKAVEIGQSQLSALCRAVGVMQLQDTSQLHNKPLRIKVKIRKDKSGQYEDQNEVSGYEPLQPQAAFQQPAAAAPAQPMQQAAPAAAPATPWGR